MDLLLEAFNTILPLWCLRQIEKLQYENVSIFIYLINISFDYIFSYLYYFNYVLIRSSKNIDSFY